MSAWLWANDLDNYYSVTGIKVPAFLLYYSILFFKPINGETWKVISFLVHLGKHGKCKNIFGLFRVRIWLADLALSDNVLVCSYYIIVWIAYFAEYWPMNLNKAPVLLYVCTSRKFMLFYMCMLNFFLMFFFFVILYCSTILCKSRLCTCSVVSNTYLKSNKVRLNSEGATSS